MEQPPTDKRRRMAAPKSGPPASSNSGRLARPVLSAINSGNNAAPPQPVEPQIQFNSRDDVEMLLAERIRGKNKNDFKGKSEQMSEYIRKLRACIRWLMELEDGLRAEEEKLKATMEAEGMKHLEHEAQLNSAIEELKLANQDLKSQCLVLNDSLKQMECLKLDALQSCEKEKELKAAIENSRAELAAELQRITQEVDRTSVQIKMLQDANKRLQEYNTNLQLYNSNLQMEAAKNGETIEKLQKEKATMMETLSNLREHNNVMKNKLESSLSTQQDAIKQKEELKNEVICLRTELQLARDERDNSLVQIQNLCTEITNYKELTGKSTKDMDNLFMKTAALEETCDTQHNQIQTLQRQLAAANEKLKLADVTALDALSSYEEQKRRVEEFQVRLANAESQLAEGEKLRKKLHNTILELKGNIRVFCRVRPLFHDTDVEGSDGPVISYPSSLESTERGIELTNQAQKYSFTFDKVFNHEASQEDIFVEISQLVQSALDGYKVCIFAYGQTGSGKTHTMIGKPELPDQKGLIPRSLEQIFQTSQSLKLQGWEYKLQASMLEIYNETIRDLLVPGGNSGFDPPGASGKQYAIKHGPSGNVYVTDLTIVDVYNIEDVSFMLHQASQSRSVGRTRMNEQSSRSHFVFTLRISGTNKNTEQQVEGVVNLIDLAGSERLAKSGSTGDRLKETQAINKSLSALSDVINAIAKKQDHVPFRNSKLTYLLQPCLGGDSKTLMFVNISPEASSANESLSSLRFAAGVNACEIGVPRRQLQHLSTIDSRVSYG